MSEWTAGTRRARVPIWTASGAIFREAVITGSVGRQYRTSAAMRST